ncbi:uncharacterized protein LOC103571062 isoform X2 [Microplitis demolitor]|uniref:uncharacterized protein LOC103571062 isoform X2 n=1 Tax=Microplitis demolitor TaxID=69319 RepID=UPI0004CD3484|nr:uncharacterized protein LOC103571062 isoform X2 [Microplitis demolitor]
MYSGIVKSVDYSKTLDCCHELAVDARWRVLAHSAGEIPPRSDDVQRSIELLDKVLSEYDEHGSNEEPGDELGEVEEGSSASGVGEAVDEADADADGQVGGRDSSTEPSIGLTPEDESPSLGHQSEDDGYMSMNGRKAKMALVALRPVPDCPEPQESSANNAPSSLEFPPPPEEAERIISTLLPIVSPSDSSKRRSTGGKSGRRGDKQTEEMTRSRHRGHAVTSQTTLPKTRRRKLYGLWDRTSNSSLETRRNSTSGKFASLPYDVQVSCDWILESKCQSKNSQERHRESASRRRRVRSANVVDTENVQQISCNNDNTNGKLEAVVDSSRDDADNNLRCKEAEALKDDDEVEEEEEEEEDGEEVEEDEIDEDELDDEDDEERRADDRDEELRGERNHSDSSCDGRFSRRRRRKRKVGLDRGVSESESERFSMPRSSSVSVERFSMRANCDSSDFSRANSTSNERFHSDFSLAVASASSNDRMSIPTSDPFSVRNLDFAVSAFSLGRADSCDERFSDVYSTRNSDFSTRNSTDFRTQSEEEERFSDDSLEEMLRSAVPQPPPMPPSPESQPVVCKRHSIAWEVSLEEDPLYAPGSTKVVGRRRRRSSDVSSVGSASKLRDLDYDWQEPHRRSTTDDDLISPYSPDSSTNELDQPVSGKRDYPTKNGTYVIRGRTRKRERKPLITSTVSPTRNTKADSTETTNVSKRYSNTFDDIKSLLLEGRLEGLNEPPPDFVPPVPPDLVRVLSLPAFDDVDAPEKTTTTIITTTNDLPAARHRTDYLSSSSSSSSPPPPAPSPRADKNNHHEVLPKSKCNGVNARGLLPTSKSLDIHATSRSHDDTKIKTSSKKSTSSASRKSDSRSEISKIPVNVLIEDQIVKKALNENRRQLEKVSDAIKELENVRNSESFVEGKRRIKDNSKKSRGIRNEVDSDSENVNETSREDEDCDQGCSSTEYDHRRKPNDTINELVYSSSRRIAQNDIDSLSKNDQRQIENVIDAILEDSKNPDFQVSVEVLEFPPLPPSPVEEADEESSDVNVAPVIVSTHYGSHRAMTRQPPRTIEYRPRVPPHRVPTIDIKDHRSSLDTTRSMDAGYSRSRRTPNAPSNSRRDVPVERRTLPTDLPGPSRRRTTTKQSPSADNAMGTPIMGTIAPPGNSGMQTSCSLPETPVFARGSDIPRTPQHTSGNTLSTTTSTMSTAATQPRRQPGWYAPTTATTGGYRRNNPGLEQAIIGTELLRLAGGPNRGWYPTRRGANQPRPASIEHLERLNSAYESRLPTAGEQRKPLTLPTNITPNKYFGQSKHSSATSGTREALRRVTSLLIKKGSTKESKGTGKDVFPAGPYSGGEPSDVPKKKGFFKNFWKRSRHYSLENQ